MDLLWWLPFGEVPEIDGEELYKRLKETPAPVVIDVRTNLEFAQGHIDGAINVPITELNSRLESLDLYTDNSVVAICLTAHRSIPAVRLFQEAGIEDACQLEGGMLAWNRAGFPTTE